MFIRKVAALSLVLLPSMFQVIVHGKKHSLLRKTTEGRYDPDSSIDDTYLPPYDHDDSNGINDEAELYLYNSTDNFPFQEPDSLDEADGGFQRHLQSSNAWVNAHNVRRQRYHTSNGKSYVPLKWSPSLANSASAWANNLLGSCRLVHSSTSAGENLAMQSWSNGSPDSVLTMWVEKEDPGNGQYIFSKSGHFSQALWRGTKYLGCGTARRSGCTIHVCRYLAPGNCNIRNNEWRWRQLVFADSSMCGPQCPAEGCF
jgi:hypothetical protein